MDPARRVPATDAWSIDDGYLDATGVWRDTGPDTHAALVSAMGGLDAAPPAREPRVIALRAGQRRALAVPAELALEDSTVLRVERELPPDLPLGYHELRPADGRPSSRVVVAPPACHLPAGLRAWGWAVQLYATRSRASWGIGDLADLRRVTSWAAGQGAGLVLVSPLYAATPVTPQESSPYGPSSRRFLNLLYLRIEDVPGAAEAELDLERLAEAGRRLDDDRRIDREAVLRLKMDALTWLWRRFRGAGDFDAFRREQGAPLTEWATFCALAERFGRFWRQWPDELRRPDGAAVARFAVEHADRIGFHAWVQWLLDRQHRAATQPIRVMNDLPVGVDPEGADAWAWQDVLATGATVGAPPDRYTPDGQNWGLPPFVPHRLAEAGYTPFIQTIRAALRHAGGLRIDHVMGLFRLFWVPAEMTPAQGAFVRYPADDLLAIVALESHRAGAVIVGEDLGTVEAGVRERLAANRILSYRLVWFETDPPSAYPELALAAVATHDLPTIRGLWTGADIAAQASIGLRPNEEGYRATRERLRQMTGLDADTPVDTVIVEAHRLLAHAPSVFVTATLEDALSVEERPNMPGTVSEWPNWSIALPEPLESLESKPLAQAVARALAER